MEILHLKVRCPGWCSYARAVWLDPVLLGPETVPGQTPFQKPNPVRVPSAGRARRAHYVVGDSWTAEHDQLIKEGVGNGFLRFGDVDWTDYDFTYEARKSDGPDGFGGMFREAGTKAYVLCLGGLDGKHHLIQWSSSTQHGEFIQSSPGTIQPRRWYRVRISLRGRRIRVELDGHMLFSLTDDFHERGAVGLRFFGSAGASATSE